MPVSTVAANSVASSAWANSVATAVNDLEPDAVAPAGVGATGAAGSSTRAARRDHRHALLGNGAAQMVSASSGSIGGGVTAIVTLTWPVAWADTNYRAFPSLELSGGSGDLPKYIVTTRTTTQVSVRIQNPSGSAQTYDVAVLGIHA